MVRESRLPVRILDNTTQVALARYETGVVGKTGVDGKLGMTKYVFVLLEGVSSNRIFDGGTRQIRNLHFTHNLYEPHHERDFSI